MGDPLVTFDLRRGRIFIGSGEELAKLFKLAPEMGTDAGKLAASSGQAAVSSEGSTAVANSNGYRTSVRDFARRFAHRKLYERIDRARTVGADGGGTECRSGSA